MAFYPFEVTTAHIIYALLGAFIVVFGMFSLLLREKLYVGEAIWAFIFGVIIGPHGANIFNPRSWGHGSDHEDPINPITLEFTRVVLAIGVFAIGVELPKAYMKKHWKSLSFLLAPVMTWGWFVSAGLMFAFIPGLNFLSSLAISACLTPTDPILASAILGGKWADKHVPSHIRHLLAAESGCNDGAAFPFLFLAMFLMTGKNVGIAIKDWFLLLWLYQIALGILIGCSLGFAFRHLMQFCERRDLIDRHSYVAQYISLASLTMGIATLLGTDDLLAAFVCGATFAWDGFFNKQTEQSVFSSVIDILFNIAAFIFVGAWMPFEAFHRNGIINADGVSVGVDLWRLIVIGVLVLIFRRLPIMMAMYKWIPDIKTWREALFSGHFGPMGIGAIFLSTFANEFLMHHLEKYPTSNSEYQHHQIEVTRDLIEPIVAFMVLCSIAAHGLSIPGFSLGRRVHSVSRTWSRRDTTGSGRTAPDWTNQARLITRGDDIVINRDVEKGEGRGVPFERTMTMMSTRTLGNGTNDDAHAKEDDVNLDSATEDTKIQADPVSILLPTTTPHSTTTNTASPIHRHQPRDDYRDQFPPDGRRHQTSEWVEGNYRVVERKSGRYGDDVDVTVINEAPNDLSNEHGHWTGDGIWRSFNVGRRRGDSGDAADPAHVEIELADKTKVGRRPTTADTQHTLVADEDSDAPRISESSSYSQDEFVVSESEPSPGSAIDGDRLDTLAPVAVSRDTPRAIASRDPPVPAPQDRRSKRRSRSLTRLHSRSDSNQQIPQDGTRRFLRIITPTTPHEVVDLNLDTDAPYDDYRSDIANASSAIYEIIEVPRAYESRLAMTGDTTPPRASRRTMSGTSLKLNSGSGMGRTSEGTLTPTGSPPMLPSSSILPPIFTSPTIPSSHHHSASSPIRPTRSRSRPSTAPTSPSDTIRTSYPPPTTTPISRPGTGDSSIRHHRLDSIRASSIPHLQQGYGQGHRTPPRDSSPPRSVRFVDNREGEMGYVGSARDGVGSGSIGNGSWNGTRMVSVVEIPPTPPIPRYYRDRDGNRRSTVDSPAEEKTESVAFSPSRPTD